MIEPNAVALPAKGAEHLVKILLCFKFTCGKCETQKDEILSGDSLCCLTASSAWAQASKPNTLADLVKYKGSDRERVLYEGAKKEGKLVWYTSLVPHKHIAKLFEAKYPGITVDIYRAAGNTLATRLLEKKC